MTAVLRALVLASLALVAAPASALTVTGETRCDRAGPCAYVVRVVAAQGEANDIVVADRGGKLFVADRANAVGAGGECTAVDPHVVQCTSGPVMVVAGEGDDRVDASKSGTPTELDGGPGADVLTGGAGDDVLHGGPGLDTIAGGGATDTVDYTFEPRGVDVDLATQTAQAAAGLERFSGVENATGGGGADRLLGDAGPNVLDGGSGGDVIDGRAGDDQLIGGAGADRLQGGPGHDTIATAAYARDDRVACGPGIDDVAAFDPGPVLALDCEHLDTGIGIDPVALHAGRRPWLGISKQLVGPPMRLRVTLSIGSRHRPERVVRFATGPDARPTGALHVALTTPPIERLRRHRAVTVVVGIRALNPEWEPKPYRASLRIRLPRA